jgi:hypothetical protein
VPLAVVVLLPQAIAEAAMGELEIEHISSVGDLVHLGVVPLAAFIALGGEALYAGIVAAAVLQWRAGHDVRLGRLVRSLPYGRLIAVDLLFSLGVAVGLALLVIPGVVFVTYFLLAAPAIKLEDRSVRDGFRRSAELVRGNFRQVLVLILAVVVGTEVASVLLALPFHAFAGDLVAHVAVEGLLEPVQGLVTVLLFLALLEARGEHEPVLARGIHP